MSPARLQPDRWYSGITRHQWLVLTIASLGWIFDVFEGQVFVAAMGELSRELVGAETPAGELSFYNNISLGMFLLGGALGGVLFGAWSDRVGRARTMIVTIVVYSLFTCLTAAAQTWWQVAILRFLVALGVGGEWAVASTMVAEHFPTRARAWSGAIFHASSVLGTLLAVAVGEWIVANPAWGWRWAFGVGALPALLTLWIRWQLRDAPRPNFQQDPAPRATSRLRELFAPGLLGRVAVGVTLAAVGLATFWGVHIHGKSAYQNARARELAAKSIDTTTTDGKRLLKSGEMTGMLLTTLGGGAGLLAFGPLSARLGRRWAFALFHLGGFAAGMVVFRGLDQAGPTTVAWVLPIFGFLTLGMHAGYAIYFPELFPTRLRGTGTGFCFNAGRIIAAPVLFGSGWFQRAFDLGLADAAAAISGLFLAGPLLLWFAPETQGTELPD